VEYKEARHPSTFSSHHYLASSHFNASNKAKDFSSNTLYQHHSSIATHDSRTSPKEHQATLQK